MQMLRNLFNHFLKRETALLVLSFIILAVEVLWWCVWGPSTDDILRGPSSPLLSSYSTIATRILFVISSLVIAGSLSAILFGYRKWLKSSEYAKKYYEPFKSFFLIVSGVALALLFMLLATWETPIWSLAVQSTVWLFLCSAAFELSPNRIAALLEHATHHRRRSVKEMVILAYSRRFGCALIGLLCTEAGAWLLYMITRDRVVNYAEAVTAFFILTFFMYLLLYIPFCWGAVFLLKGRKRN